MSYYIIIIDKILLTMTAYDYRKNINIFLSKNLTLLFIHELIIK